MEASYLFRSHNHRLRELSPPLCLDMRVIVSVHPFCHPSYTIGSYALVSVNFAAANRVPHFWTRQIMSTALRHEVGAQSVRLILEPVKPLSSCFTKPSIVYQNSKVTLILPQQ
jgi:hypothetical protein